MAGTSYTRQSTLTDGDTITASLFNIEYDKIVSAFTYASTGTTGHQHDGGAGEGGNIEIIGDQNFLNKIVVDSTNNRWGVFVEVGGSAVEQIRIQDGAIVPVTDSDIDLGTSSLEFKDGFFDGTIHVDTLDVDANATIAGTLDVTGNTTVGGTLVVTGATTFNGGTLTLGDAAGDNVVFGADVNSNIIPNTDSAFDLGSSSQEWRDLYLDGTAHIDTLDVDVNATVAGTLGVTGVLTATSLDISGDIDVDGTTNLDVVDIDGAVDMASTLAVTGVLTATSLDISGDVDVDGTLETDALSLNGTAVTSTAAELNILDGVTSTAAELNLLDGVTSTTAELNILDGVTSTAAELNILDGVTSTAAELNILDGVTASATDINLIDGITNGTVIASKAIITDANIDITGGRNITISGELSAATLDISGNVDVDGTLETDALTIGGVTLAETISDTVGAMVSSNTETNIAVTYQDADNTLDFVIGTLNQDTTGLAATATALATARTIHGVSFDGTANIDLSEVVQDTVGAMFTSNTESGITVAYQDADGTVDFTVGTLNQDTTGLAGTATALATARTIGGVSFDGTANITPTTFAAATFSGDLNVDSGVLFADVSTNRVGINQASPDVSLDIGANTDAVHLPVGTTAQRPSSPAAGYFRYNSSLSAFEGYTDAWGSIGGGGTNTFTHDVFTCNGSTTAFALSQSTESENNLMVFVDGAFQEQGAYSIATASGTTTLTMSVAPANTRKLVVYTVAAAVSGSNLNIDSMTGDGSDTTLTLSIAPVNENNTQVFIDGVYQGKSTYSISGTTLTFSTAPPNTSAVEVMTMTQTDINVPVDGTITSAKLSGALTTPSTLAVTGEITANAGIALPDSQKATFGASDDLQIYHDGSHSRIVDAGTGNLSLQGNDLRIKNSDASATYIQAANGGAVDIAYAGNTKLSTTNTGIDVTGSVVADGLNVTSSSSNAGTFKAVGGYAVQAYQDATSADHTALELRSDHVAGGTNRYLIRGYNTAAGTPVESFKVDTAGGAYFGGRVTMPLQPAFSVEPSSTLSNIPTGETTVVFGTEIFDQGSNFASNTFTAPVTGKYQLNAMIRLNSLDSASGYYVLEINTSNRDYKNIIDPDFGQDAVYWSLSISVLADMDAGDVSTVSVSQSSGTSQTDIIASGYTRFTGYLVA